MSDVTNQYEAFPYPERDPKDEAKRLITGSPSHPLEIDHFCHEGHRDWSKPFRALVAGGGTGDALIQLAQVLTSANVPHEITYIDLSAASRRIAEARAEARSLTSITFHTGSLLDAPDYGEFDYIDCCGVLHHLPEPNAGFQALREALASGGAMGFMVYAPYGRSGVYPLQEAFSDLLEDLPPEDRLARAKAIFGSLPDSHPFKRNKLLTDHETSDAGFYDLLLHSQDRAYDVETLLDTLDSTDWQLLSFATPALYDLARIAPVPDGMSPARALATAERLNGTLRLHVAYAAAAGEARTLPKPTDMTLVPHLRGVGAQALAKAVAQGKPIPIRHSGLSHDATLPKTAAPVIAAIDGRRRLSDLATIAKLDPMAFGAAWGPVHRTLCDWGLMLYSDLLRPRR